MITRALEASYSDTTEYTIITGNFGGLRREPGARCTRQNTKSGSFAKILTLRNFLLYGTVVLSVLVYVHVYCIIPDLLQENGAHQESLDSLLLHVKPSLSLQWVRGELHCLVVILDQKPSSVMTY